MSTSQLRDSFLVSDLFVPGQITLRVTDLDRAIIGGAVPTTGALRLDAIPDVRAEFFAERREIGILNTGGHGKVEAGQSSYDLSAKDVLYIGRGTRDISFTSTMADEPARFYIVSYPAHAEFPTTLVRAADAQQNELGSSEGANRRRIARYIHAEGARSAQLVMGVTTLETGSVWNTMPAHVHSRRSEIYLYFDLPENAMIIHLMGEPQELRPLVIRDGEAALSPGWSVHAGCGTSAYSFCWAMGGENQDYADMDAVSIGAMK